MRALLLARPQLPQSPNAIQEASAWTDPGRTPGEGGPGRPRPAEPGSLPTLLGAHRAPRTPSCCFSQKRTGGSLESASVGRCTMGRRCALALALVSALLCQVSCQEPCGVR